MTTDFASSAGITSHSRQTAIVIGAGLIGSALALRLQASGIATTLVDSEALPRGASWGNAGHIATEQVEPLASPAALRSFHKRLFWRGGALAFSLVDVVAWLPFVGRLLAASRPHRFNRGRIALGSMISLAMDAWHRLLAEAKAPEMLREEGHFVVWESQASAAAGLQRWEAADIGNTSFRPATTVEIEQLQALADRPIAGAIRFSGSGQISDLTDLAAALARQFLELGGVRLCATAAPMQIDAGQAVIPFGDGSRLRADAIIVAAGARSAELLRPLGHCVPLVAERGYHIQSAETDWPADMPPVVFEDRSMIVTRFRSGLRAASIVEFGRVDTPPDRRKWDRLRGHVTALGLPFTLPGSEWMGARPTLPDYLPAIGRSSRADNLFYAFGHQHLGLTLAAVTGDAMAALITGDATPFDLTPFSLDRFGA